MALYNDLPVHFTFSKRRRGKTKIYLYNKAPTFFSYIIIIYHRQVIIFVGRKELVLLSPEFKINHEIRGTVWPPRQLRLVDA